MSWASVAAPNKVKRPNSTPQGRKAERIPVQPQVIERINEIDRRTQVLRKVPSGSTTQSILADLKSQCDGNLGDVVEAVVQEPLDRRRFYIRYKSIETKRANARKGFRIGEIVIPPERADVKGYIPDVPHYLSKEDMVGILSRYGEVISGDFKKFEDTEIRCGGFDFELDLHPNQRLPGLLQILSDTLTLKTKDDIMRCTYCDTYGHIQRNCRKKLADRMRQAHFEIMQQPQGGDTQQMETEAGDTGVQNEQTAPPAKDATTATAGTPAPQPKAPGETQEQTANEDQGNDAINSKIYKVTDNPALPDLTYQQLDEMLQTTYNERFELLRTGFLTKNNRPLDDHLTEDEYKQLKEKGWIEGLRHFQMKIHFFDQYKPFMEDREQVLRASHPTTT